MRPGGRGDEDGHTMIHPSIPIDTAAEALERLRALRFELAIAGPAGLLEDADYRQDIEDELESSETAFVGLAVTEIATLRGELAGRLLG